MSKSNATTNRNTRNRITQCSPRATPGSPGRALDAARRKRLAALRPKFPKPTPAQRKVFVAEALKFVKKLAQTSPGFLALRLDAMCGDLRIGPPDRFKRLAFDSDPEEVGSYFALLSLVEQIRALDLPARRSAASVLAAGPRRIVRARGIEPSSLIR